MSSQLSRGLRNCNPGNIRRTRRQGLYRGEVEQASDPEFRTFAALKWGYRAMFVVLYTYQKRHRLNTPRQWIERWAPPEENNTEAYLKFVCQRAEVEPDQPISALEESQMLPFVAAMSQIENGQEASMEKVLAGWHLFFADFGPDSTKKR